MTDNRRGADVSPTPEGNDYLAELIRSVSAEPSSEATQGSPIDKPRSPDMITSLLSNPELLSKLPAIISAVKPIMEIMGSGALGSASASQEPRTAAQTPHGSIPVGGSALQAPSQSSEHRGGGTAPMTLASNSHHGGDRRAQLLCALKPYLCEDRRRAIDYVIKLDRLGDVLKSL
jgi:hypothetical protein